MPDRPLLAYLTHAIGRSISCVRPIQDPWLLSFETYFDVGSATHLNGLLNFPFIPLSFFLMLAVLIAAHIVLSRTRFGLDLKTVGGNPEAARLAGVRVDRTIVAAYALSGFAAGLAAVILVARLTTSTEQLGTGMELTAISAAVIGGVSLQGGVGTATGPALGAFLLGVIRSVSRWQALPVRAADRSWRHPHRCGLGTTGFCRSGGAASPRASRGGEHAGLA